MDYAVVIAIAAMASTLTFFAGFGLGTLLLPAFALFFPLPIAVALTAYVHFLNGLFKLVLVGRRASWRVVLRFGVPAMLAAFAGAEVLLWLSDLSPVTSYMLGSKTFTVLPVKLVIAALMVGFAVVELSGRIQRASLRPSYLPIGGLVSGFFGGLSGHQGAFRTVFLLRAGLDKEAFIGTGVAIAALIDVTRISVYLSGDTWSHLRANAGIVAAGTAAAFAGAYVGSRLLKKVHDGRDPDRRGRTADRRRGGAGRGRLVMGRYVAAGGHGLTISAPSIVRAAGPRRGGGAPRDARGCCHAAATRDGIHRYDAVDDGIQPRDNARKQAIGAGAL